MDIYEFTQVLRRRKWLLVAGFSLLVAFVMAISFDFSDGFKLRTTPKHQAIVRMAVVPAGYESLGQDLGPDTLGGTAQVFSSLLASPQAALEISQQQGARILEFGVGATGRDRFLTVTVISDTPEGAVAASRGAFTWLEQRLSEPLVTASTPTTSIPEPEVLDTNGQFEGMVRLEADHSLAVDSDGLWIMTEVSSGTDFAYRLADAAEEPSVDYRALLTPGEDLSIRLEDAAGRTLDEVLASVPQLPAEASSSYELLISLNRGFVRGTVEDPALDSALVTASWLPTELASGVEEPGLSDVGVLLLTDEPVPESVGGRKTPLLMIALLTAGFVALLVIAVIVDSWSLERRRQADIYDPKFESSHFTQLRDEVDQVLGRVSS